MNNSNLKIFNSFGITPTTNFTAAGLDFYIPNLDSEEKITKWQNAIIDSKRATIDELTEIYGKVVIYTCYKEQLPETTLWNIVQLYVSLDSSYINEFCENVDEKVESFVNDYLIFDNNNKPGIKLSNSDHTLFNSGIKVALDHNTAGIFFNKSGKGNKGFDVRAQVVDEDYAGFVHLSNAYTKDNENDGIIYVGDKLTQMVVLPIILVDKCNEMTEEEYNEVMKDSNRGAKAFGSSDEKH